MVIFSTFLSAFYSTYTLNKNITINLLDIGKLFANLPSRIIPYVDNNHLTKLRLHFSSIKITKFYSY